MLKLILHYIQDILAVSTSTDSEASGTCTTESSFFDLSTEILALPKSVLTTSTNKWHSYRNRHVIHTDFKKRQDFGNKR